MMVLDNEFNTYFNLKKIRRLSKSLDVAGRQVDLVMLIYFLLIIVRLFI